MSLALVAGLLAMSLPPSPRPEGFLAEPKSGLGQGVLVLHPWWGLNEDVKVFCRKLADEGYVAFAPDLFHGKTATTEEEAQALTKAHGGEDSKVGKEVSDAARYLDERVGKGGIGVVGFSYGAYYALHLSNADPDRTKAVVVFYGTGEEDFSKSKAAYLGHFAADDDFEPKEAVDALRKALSDAGRSSMIVTYQNTGHWFFEPSVKKAYDEGASKLAWKSTLQFLKQNLK